MFRVFQMCKLGWPVQVVQQGADYHSPWPSQPWPETKALWFGGHSHLLQGNVEVLWWRYRLVMALWAQLISTPRSRVAVSGDPTPRFGDDRYIGVQPPCSWCPLGSFPSSRGLEAFASACWLCLDWVSCQAASQNHKSPWLILGWGQASLRPAKMGSWIPKVDA